MIRFEWVSDRLCDVVKWQLAHPNGKDDLSAPEVPAAGQRIWAVFLELAAARGSGGFGPDPISYSHMEAWSRLHREPLRSFEIDMLRTMDSAFLEAVAERADGSKKPEVSTTPFSLEGFDAALGI